LHLPYLMQKTKLDSNTSNGIEFDSCLHGV
jgi:hypothetical protein